MPRYALAMAALWTSFAFTAPASAQVRSWVSGVGDDLNPCSRTAPCRTFAGAISKTAAGGEISVLDPGSFGAVTITKSISIVAEGSEGGITAALVNAIIVNAGATDRIHLQGLVIEGSSNGLNGIRFLAGGTLHVRDCVIRGFRGGTGFALEIVGPGPSQVFVSDSTLAANLGGILVRPMGAGQIAAFLDRVRIEGNAGPGVEADGEGALIRLSQSTVTHNDVGLEAVNGGEIVSFKNNVVLGNLVDGKPNRKAKLR
jgi:hypothetical protein